MKESILRKLPLILIYTTEMSRFLQDVLQAHLVVVFQTNAMQNNVIPSICFQLIESETLLNSNKSESSLKQQDWGMEEYREIKFTNLSSIFLQKKVLPLKKKGGCCPAKLLCSKTIIHPVQNQKVICTFDIIRTESDFLDTNT